MGKIRTRLIGDTEVEAKQKLKSKERAARKKKQEKIVEENITIEVENVVEKSQEDKTGEKKSKKITKKSEQIKKKRGNKYLQAKQKIESGKIYPLNEAIGHLKKLTYAKFDESVELHLNTTEEGLRGEVTLPNSIGRSVRVAIVDDAVLTEIEKGVIEFDVLISHPSFMSKLAKFAKILGPKGLMPNPKAGTIGLEPEKLAEKYKKGSIRWKTEAKFPLIHQMIGKISLKSEQIHENAKSFIDSVGAKKITKAYIKLTMSPSLQIDLQSI